MNVTEPLDRETRDSYVLKLTASDRGNLTSTIPIHISISDINDNVPIFDQQTPYILNISENTLPSLVQPLLHVHAVDHDANENARISYNFSPQVSDLIRQTFRLNSQTGELFLLQPVDYEQHKDYRIQITAQDSGPVSVPVYTVVLLNIEDENDNKPLVNIRVSEYFQFTNDTFYVSEETPVNTLLMHVLVQDLDSNLNGQVHCSIDSSGYAKFNITSNINHMFGIYTAQRFDREQHSNYSLRLIVEDNGLKIRHRTVRDLRLFITDVNDCAPRFSRSIYNLSVQEEEEHREPLIQFQAIDDDLNENGVVSYELLSKEYQYTFFLNERTGELFLRDKLDREVQAEYNLTVRARDHGTYPSTLFTDVSCLIHVLDKNEYKPEFEKDKYLFHHLPENSSINTSVGFVRATDRDGHLITYSISSPDFFIDALTGELQLRKVLDYDTNPTCRMLSAVAKDPDGSYATCLVEICLKPINEHSPEIHADSRLLYINIHNTSSIDLRAFDRDYSPASFLSFQCETSSKCNLACLPNGTMYLPSNQSCLGIVDIKLQINDNDPQPLARIANETVRLIFYSNSMTLRQILTESTIRFTFDKIIVAIIVLLIFIIIGLALSILYKHRKQLLSSHSKTSNSKGEHLRFAEVSLTLTPRHTFLSSLCFAHA